SSFSSTLQSTTGDLEDEPTPEVLRTMTQRLLKETRRMQDTNRKLEQKLEAARDDLSALQRDLDEARKESMLDPLTKIFNRKCFDEGLVKAMTEASSY